MLVAAHFSSHLLGKTRFFPSLLEDGGWSLLSFFFCCWLGMGKGHAVSIAHVLLCPQCGYKIEKMLKSLIV